MRNDRQSGQTLIEALVALAAAVIIISSITVAVVTSVNNTGYSTRQNTATQLAQEALDEARGLRDSDYATFAQKDGTYCFGSNDVTFSTLQTGSNCQSPNIDSFIRTVQFVQPTNTDPCDEATEVRALVVWTDGKCPANNYCHKVQLVSCLSDTQLFSDSESENEVVGGAPIGQPQGGGGIGIGKNP